MTHLLTTWVTEAPGYVLAVVKGEHFCPEMKISLTLGIFIGVILVNKQIKLAAEVFKIMCLTVKYVDIF